MAVPNTKGGDEMSKVTYLISYKMPGEDEGHLIELPKFKVLPWMITTGLRCSSLVMYRCVEEGKEI